MMKNKKSVGSFFNKSTLLIVGIVVILILALVLLWHSNETSNQADPAFIAQVYFEGRYRIEDGPWKEIKEGEHIPCTQGDVTLQGNFHILAPDGEYVGLYSGGIPIAFYVNHISVTIFDGENEPYKMDIENPLFGDSSCGEYWYAYTFAEGNDGPIEILIHNPHGFGNETAIDEMLSRVAFWMDMNFEKGIIQSGEPQRSVGILFIIISLLCIGTALLLTLIHTKNSKIIWIIGAAIASAGVYFAYSAEGVSLWSESIVSNTTMLGCSMMFYMLFLSLAIVYFTKHSRTVGIVAVAALGTVNALFFVLPVVTDILFYDLWQYWIIAQGIVNTVLFVCILKELCVSKGVERWINIGFILPLTSFGIDVVLTGLGFWRGGLVSKYVFIALCAVSIISLLKMIPESINALTKAKELEAEKIMLNAKLTESRVSTMMSQIRPHFIYNTLGSIEQLCNIDPPKAGELVHNFAKYLRGNFGELDNPKPILMSQEMEHVHHYISIENVRFPDMTFSFEMNSVDFYIPALTIQPIVENAIKHGLMKLPKGGQIRVTSYETDKEYCVSVEDDGVGFDTDVLLNERKHVGIRNIRGRLKAMVNGTIEIESTVGVGTRVLITIPKEERK